MILFHRMYQEFLTNPKRYRMYWARNYIGWPEFSAFQPNETHKTFAKWEAENKVNRHFISHHQFY